MIIYNLLPKSYEDEIENVLLGNNFPWYYYALTSDPNHYNSNVTSMTRDCQQFSHMFFSETLRSDYYSLVLPIVILLEKHTGRRFSNRIIRIKANYINREQNYLEGYHNIPHSDGNNVETLLYYVNNSDGDTIIFNEKPSENKTDNLTINQKIAPEKGKCLLFDSDRLHASSPPKTNTNRVVLNMVFEKE